MDKQKKITDANERFMVDFYLTHKTYMFHVAKKFAQFASTDCPFRMSGVGSSVEAVWAVG